MDNICNKCGLPIPPQWQDGKTIGGKLKLLRAAKRLGVREAAAFIGINPGTLSKMENDKQNTRIGTICKVIDYYGVSYDDVLQSPDVPEDK